MQFFTALKIHKNGVVGCHRQQNHYNKSLVEERIWNRYLNTYAGITEPLLLAVEVASSNWDDDYIDK